MKNLEIKTIAIDDDARAKIVIIEHRGEDEFDERCEVFQRCSSMLVEVDCFDTETNEGVLTIDATLCVPGYIDYDHPEYYESLEEYVGTMRAFIEGAIEDYAGGDDVEYTYGVENYDTTFHKMWKVKLIQDDIDNNFKYYNPTKMFEDKKESLERTASDESINVVLSRIEEEKARHGTTTDHPFGRVWDTIDQMTHTINVMLPRAKQNQVEAIEELKTISITEFEIEFDKALAYNQGRLDKAMLKAMTEVA